MFGVPGKPRVLGSSGGERGQVWHALSPMPFWWETAINAPSARIENTLEHLLFAPVSPSEKIGSLSVQSAGDPKSESIGRGNGALGFPSLGAESHSILQKPENATSTVVF